MARKFKELQEKQSEDIDDPAQMLNKYLSLRSKGRLAQLERTVPVREKRDHSVPVERMMSEIQEATRTDDWGLPVRFKKRETKFCCEKHWTIVQHRFKQYTAKIGSEVIAWLREELDEADVFKDGHIQQNQLLRLAEEILYEFGVEPTDVVLRNIMDSAAVGDERLVFNLATYQHMIRDLIIAAETKRLDNLAGHSEEEKEDESHAAVDTPNTGGDLRRRGNGGYRLRKVMRKKKKKKKKRPQ
eukprot:FR741084.1.p1 GENE.FR741084.1~~FR741084.1.p1  ORF type:complete len:281 (+),score=49.42 FR741084.1:116-844(+)